jgi:hypothetical protein
MGELRVACASTRNLFADHFLSFPRLSGLCIRSFLSIPDNFCGHLTSFFCACPPLAVTFFVTSSSLSQGSSWTWVSHTLCASGGVTSLSIVTPCIVSFFLCGTRPGQGTSSPTAFIQQAASHLARRIVSKRCLLNFIFFAFRDHHSFRHVRPPNGFQQAIFTKASPSPCILRLS